MKHLGDSGSNLMKTEKELSPESVGFEGENVGCGFGRCRPRFLQFFANPIVFMIILNIYCLVEGAIVSGEPD